MRRHVLVILAVISLCLAPYVAAAHSIAMTTHAGASEPAAPGTNADHAAMGHDMTEMAPSGCPGGDCAEGCDQGAGSTHKSAICAWVCAAMSVAQPLLTLPDAAPQPRASHPLPELAALKGTEPPLADRPPNPLSL